MTVPRFFVPPTAIEPESLLIKSGNKQLIKQISKVLRLNAGDRIDFLDGNGNLFRAVLKNLDEKELTAQIEEQSSLDLRAAMKISIGLSLLKNDRFDWAIEKLTELGVWQICPLEFKRTVVRIKQDSFSTSKSLRWESIATEASEQSERMTIPKVFPPKTFPEFIAECNLSNIYNLKLVCAERIKAPHISKILDNNPTGCGAQQTCILIGPEGGIQEDELQLSIENDFQPISLGSQILRSETAAIYALAIVASKNT